MFKKSTDHLSIGARGEKSAQEYLRRCGYKLLEVNFTNSSGRRLGEIDIIAKDGDEIVFIEVKTRKKSSAGSGLPEENITATKLYKLNKIAVYYLRIKQSESLSYRFDAITVMANMEDNTATLRHLKNIFI